MQKLFVIHQNAHIIKYSDVGRIKFQSDVCKQPNCCPKIPKISARKAMSIRRSKQPTNQQKKSDKTNYIHEIEKKTIPIRTHIRNQIFKR